MSEMGYLFAAYTVVWALIFGYVVSLSGRQKRLNQELETLKRMIEEKKA